MIQNMFIRLGKEMKGLAGLDTQHFEIDIYFASTHEEYLTKIEIILLM